MTGNDGDFHVRRVSPTKWQEKPTRETYNRNLTVKERTMERGRRKIANLEDELEKSKGKEDGLEDVNAIRKAMNRPSLEEELKKEQEGLADDEQELKSLEKWISLPEDVIGPVETQYQRYLLHGERA
jgi:hypothetical protein